MLFLEHRPAITNTDWTLMPELGATQAGRQPQPAPDRWLFCALVRRVARAADQLDFVVNSTNSRCEHTRDRTTRLSFPCSATTFGFKVSLWVWS